ncbi:hypothetical protein NFJ01_21370 [Lelliottia amnigena]|uniref:hypothetical protein n=1 Tax=Lelliottia amnigena TaxID=61646 RepID=UPI002090EB11|nr:hypothetical protein [Lelliottia amnigena]USR60747.1 hypothetical protein NFJ01_21370 [Lelliottia amnigena]
MMDATVDMIETRSYGSTPHTTVKGILLSMIEALAGLTRARKYSLVGKRAGKGGILARSDKADITIALSRSFVDAAQREIAQNPRT